MMRFIVEIESNPEYAEDYPDEILVRAKLEDGTIIGTEGGPIGNPNIMGYVGLQIIREYRASRTGVPVQPSGIMSQEDIDEEIARIIPI